MAYLDKGGTRPGAASAFGALAVNAAMVAAIIYSVPDILPQEPWKILNTYAVTPTPARPQPKKAPKQAVKTANQNILVPSVTPVRAQTSDNELNIAGIDEGIVGGTGGIVTPLLPAPVFKGAQIDPRYVGVLQPAYPPGMIREEREGVVTVRILVAADGRVKALEAVRADAPAFLEATRRQALSKWRFLPATRDGEPVESWREMTVRFELPN